MLAKTVKKKQCTFARRRAINKLFHIGRYFKRFIARYRAIYWPILQISTAFYCKWYGGRFPHIVLRYRQISRPTQPIFKTGRILIQDIVERIWGYAIVIRLGKFVLDIESMVSLTGLWVQGQVIKGRESTSYVPRIWICIMLSSGKFHAVLSVGRWVSRPDGYKREVVPAIFYTTRFVTNIGVRMRSLGHTSFHHGNRPAPRGMQDTGTCPGA